MEKEPVYEQVTLWFDPEEKFLTGKGLVTRRQWCHDERDRLTKAGRLVEVRTDILGKMAVFAEVKHR